MIKNTLLQILKSKVDAYKKYPYTLLLNQINDLEPIVIGNGKYGDSDYYEGEIIFVIDNKQTGDVRIIGEINDGHKEREFYNVIITPSGNASPEG